MNNWLWACASLMIFGAGCTQYQSKPLTSAAVKQRLAVPDEHSLSVAAARLHHPILKPIRMDLSKGLSPDEAAVLAVILNPQLRAERDQRAIASAQLLQAGLLPNPQLTGGMDFPYSSSPPDNFNAYNVGLDWEITSLITHDAKVRAASSQFKSVQLDIAWSEWQIAEQAKLAAFDAIALGDALHSARQADRQLAENLHAVQHAVNQHEKTLLDLSAAQTASQDAHAVAVAEQRDLTHQTLQLNRALGLPPERALALEHEPLPSHLDPPPAHALLDHLEEHRLDLLALKRGYESQDATLRAAILEQFPKISLGFNAAQDTSNVHTIGFGVAIDIPIFDRNQGVIAAESATRQKLFDEYADRVFEARSDIAMAVSDIRSTNQEVAVAEAAVPELEQLVQTYQAALKQGNVDILSYYSARSMLWQKRLDVIRLKQQLVDNWIALEIAAGRYLPMQTSPPTSPAATQPASGEKPQ